MADLQSTDHASEKVLLKRLQRAVTDYTFDEDQHAFRSSYGSWHFVGHCQNNARAPASKESVCRIGDPLHPCLDIDRIENEPDSFNFSGDTGSVIVAQVSKHIMRLEREYKLADMLYRERTIGSHHFIRPLRFVHLSPGSEEEEPLAAMIIAAPGDDYLADMALLVPGLKKESRMTVHMFLTFAIQACECMETLHYRHVLTHGELRPDAFHLDQATRKVRIVNSGCGIRSVGQTPGGTGLDQGGLESKELNVGYYAPEQTGRFGAESDMRTDIYSLGVSFWSILLNQHAFSGQDAANTLQNMLFRKLHSVTSQRPEVPAAISAIVGKMIKRSSQDRYPGIRPIKDDLIKVQRYLIDGDTFALGEFKVSDVESTCVFRLPKQLVGRCEEQAKMKQTMEKVLRQLSQTMSNNQAQLGVLNSPSVSSDDESEDGSTEQGTVIDEHSEDSFDDDSFDDTYQSATTEDSYKLKDQQSSSQSPRPASRRNESSYSPQGRDGNLSMAEVLKRTTMGQSSNTQELGNKVRVAQQLRRGGKVQVVALIGATGIGKTRVVRHLRETSRSYCYFAYAKFDRTKDRPFESLFQLLSCLLLQIFSERNTDTMFHETIQEYISPHWDELRGHLHLAEMSADTLLGSFKPMYATTIGEIDTHQTSAAAQADLSEHEDNSAAQTLMETGTTNNNPRFVHILLEIFRLMAVQKLVLLCLDDLRHADSESLEFIGSLIDSSIPMMIVLTSQSVQSDNPHATRLLERAERMELSKFNSEEIEEYVAATIGRSVEYCVPLASLLEEHTHGNPALMGDMIDRCYRSRWLYYCWKCTQWEYKLRPLIKHFQTKPAKRLETHALLLRHFSALSPMVQAVLQWAAVIGYSFSYKLLKAVTAKAPDDAMIESAVPEPVNDALAALQAAVSRQILRSSDDDDCYRFSDDNYYDAATLQTPAKQKAEMSYVVACTMLDFRRQKSKYGANLDIFDHARLIIASREIVLERRHEVGSFCRVLTQAAEMSRDSGALSKAAKLFKHAVDFLHSDHARLSNRDGLMLQVKAAESLALISDHTSAIHVIQSADAYAENKADKALIAIIRSRAYAAKGDHEASFRTLRDELDLAPLQDMSAPSLTECDDRFWPITKRCLKLRRRSFESTAKEDHKALASLLIELLSSLFWRDEARSYQVALVLVQLHNDAGVLSGAALGLIHLAAVSMYRFGDSKHASALRQHATQLLGAAKHETYLMCRMSITASLLMDHLEPDVQAITRSLSSSTEASASAGDQNLHLLNLAALASVRLEHSDDLAQIETYIERSSVELANWQTDTQGGVVLLAIQQCVRALQGKTKTGSADTILDDEKHNGREYLNTLSKEDPESEVALGAYTAAEVMTLFLYGFIAEALDKGTEMLPVLQGYRRLPSAYRVFCYISLAIAHRLREDPQCEDREELIELFDALRSEIHGAAASHSPLHTIWTHLLSAEDPTGNHGATDETRAAAYDRAIQHASHSRLMIEEALALELYARFLLTKNCIFTAYHLLNLSISAYAQMSAYGKADQVRARYQNVLGGSRLPRMVLSVPEMDDNADAEMLFPDEHAFAPPSTQGKLGEAGTSDIALLAQDNGSFDLKSHSISAGLDTMDLQTVLHATQLLSSELNPDQLYDKLAKVLLSITGAEACAILVESDDEHDWSIVSTNAVEGIKKPTAGVLLKDCEDWLIKQTMSQVLRFQDDLLVVDIFSDTRFGEPPHDVHEKYPDGQSVLCLPIIYGGRTLLGVIYCEAHPKTFSSRMTTLLKLIVVQTAISIYNALLFKKTEKMSATCTSMLQAQKDALAQAKKAEQKAREAEAKSLFLANVSHELRTPLNGIVGMTEILRTTELDEKQLDCASSISLCADTLLGIINDILDFSKLEAGKMQVVATPCKLAETLRATIHTLSLTKRDNINDVKLETVIEIDDDLVVVCDATRFRQLFMNLVSNAFKFTPAGSIIVRCRMQREDEERAEIIFAVEDTGIGVSAEQIGKLFAPFSQADASTAKKYGGTGLGLSICKAIVERIMEGKIWLRSIPDVGTTVAFSIPFRKYRAEVMTQPIQIKACVEGDKPPTEIKIMPPVTAREIDVPRDQVRICIAEDNPINRRIAISYVNKLKIQYEAYEDGRLAVDAINKANEDGKPFHIVLMDVMMPVLDGPGATKELRESSDPVINKVVIIAMTANAIPGDREKCLEAGMDNYLAKPVRLSAIKEMLDQYLKS